MAAATRVPHAAEIGRHRHSADAPAKGERDHRSDLQGLRAIAVALVVIYHLYPTLVPGGYVGVDVFFVISGFLITSQIARTLRTTGRLSLLQFYGRRARRLMPAAVLVLSVTWLVSLQVLPTTRLPDAADQIRASALYFQNWVLAHDAVAYLKSDVAASPVQHFWSLSVEEQFYLLWPLLFLTAVRIGFVVARRRRETVTSDVAIKAMFAISLVVVAGSLWYSAHATAANPNSAYFATTTRMWEFAVGGALALTPTRLVRRWSRLGPLAWGGLALVVVSAFVVNGGSAFPGLIALLPVCGSALLIGCGALSARFGPGRLMSLAPLVFIGDISYSLYLWHWPIIVLWKARSGGGIGALDGPAIVAVSIALAWLTKVLVEDTFRRSRFLARSTIRPLATVLIVVVPIGMVTAWSDTLPPLRTHAPVGIAEARSGGPPGSAPVIAQVDPNYPGAAVLAGDVTHVPREPPRPDLVDAPNDFTYGQGPGGCRAVETSSTETTCRFGDTLHPTRTVYVVGDSEAAQFFDDLSALANQNHWLLVTDVHTICPWTATMTAFPGRDSDYVACHDWGQRALARVLAARPAMVITSARPAVGIPGHPSPDATSFAAIAKGMAIYWKQLLARGIAVTALRETPEMGINIPDCLSRPEATLADCAVSAPRAIVRHTPLELAKDLVPKATLIDLNQYFCTRAKCNPIIGNIVVYIDSHHVTRAYASTVAPYLCKQLLALPPLR